MTPTLYLTELVIKNTANETDDGGEQRTRDKKFLITHPMINVSKSCLISVITSRTPKLPDTSSIFRVINKMIKFSYQILTIDFNYVTSNYNELRISWVLLLQHPFTFTKLQF
jgi:hypothetical protein